MPGFSLGPGRDRGLVVALLLLASAGCGSSATLDALGISGLAPSGSWKPADPASFVVPGRAIAAWTGPEGSSLVVYRALPAPRTDAEGLVREMTTRMENLPDLRVIKAGVRTVAGVSAAWVEIVAPGTGDALAPSGLGKPIAPEGKRLVPTRRVAIGIAGRDQIVWFLWHSPESAASSLATEVDAAVAKLTIRDGPSSPS
jgi:hypothetical protein